MSISTIFYLLAINACIQSILYRNQPERDRKMMEGAILIVLAMTIYGVASETYCVNADLSEPNLIEAPMCREQITSKKNEARTEAWENEQREREKAWQNEQREWQKQMLHVWRPKQGKM